MFRIFLFLLIVLGLGLLFVWIADNPGTVFLKWDWLSTQITGETGNEIGIPLTLAFAGMVLLVALTMFVIGLFRGIFGMPGFLTKYFETRRRDRGYKALSRGLIAASSGDIDMAKSASRESGKLLGNEPLVDLLATQTALLEGKREQATENFKKMLDNDDTKLVALRGLFLEAERQGEPVAARHYAEEAVKISSALPWAGNAKLSYQAADEDWDDAIITLDANRAAGLVDKDTAKRQRAVLLTAKAMSQEAAEPETARNLAKQAHKLAPDMVPAATSYASAASRMGDIRSASKVIETTWKKSPHPELAAAYATVRPGDSVTDRLKRAKKLAALQPDHPESCLAVAIAAIDAQEWTEARKALEPVLTTQPTERACLLMADIEEGEHGDQGRMRDWLSRAVRAQPDPKWVSEGYLSEEWMPVSPVTGEIDAFEWKAPVEKLGNLSAPVMTVEQLSSESKPIEQNPDKHEKKQSKTEASTDASPVLRSAVSPAAAEIAAKAANAESSDAKSKNEANSRKPKDSAEIIEIAAANDASNSEAAQAQVSADAKSGAAEKRNPPDQPAEPDNTVKFPLERRPDDPGVHPDKQKEKDKKGFGLF